MNRKTNKKKSVKPVRKFISSKRTIGKSGSSNKVRGKVCDGAYDRGFNDGYAKGLEDGAIDN